MFSERIRSITVVGFIAMAFWCAGTMAGECLARWAERHPGIQLWGDENWLTPLSPTSFAAGHNDERDRDEKRLLILGPSEIREGVLIDRIGKALGRPVSMVGLSMATLDDAEVMLNLIEQRYGSTAIPDEILLGMTTRFLLNAAYGGTPFLDAIDRYTEFHVSRLPPYPTLENKGRGERILSWLRWQGHQAKRYRQALRFAWHCARHGTKSAANTSQFLPPRYHSRKPRKKAAFFEFARSGQRPDPKAFYFYEPLRNMDPAGQASIITDRFRRFLATCERLEIRLRIVNLPEGPWARDFYSPGCYEDYWSLLRDLTVGLPLLDARDLLPGDEFFDWNHPDRAGAERLTERLVPFLATADLVGDQKQPE